MIRNMNRWRYIFISLTGVAVIMAVASCLLLDRMFAGRWDGSSVKPLMASLGLVLGVLAIGVLVWMFWISKRLALKMADTLQLVRYYTEAAAAGQQSELDCRAPALPSMLDEYIEHHRSILMDLQGANRFLQSMIQHTSDAIYVLDLDMNVEQVNPAFEQLYGYHSSEVVGKRTKILPDRLVAEACKLVSNLREGQQINGYETIRLTKDGREIHVSLTLSPIRDESGEMVAVAAISRNITERKATEELLRRSEKLSVVGQLAAGVAHEIRNPLTTLRGFVQLLQQRNAGNQAHLELMLEELDRINFIVSEFIILSKPHLNHFAFKSLIPLLDDMLKLLEPQANLVNIRMEARFAEDLPRIKCEENQLKQVFLNVLKNGMEAMPDGGEITVEASPLDTGRVMVRIIDRGGGIPEELLPRLGEPFLTGKENGTGLGIMISQQIVANHRGNMLIRSELGKGTCVDIVLPVDFEAAEV